MCPPGRERLVVSDLREAFDVIDVDRDGKISAEDLRTFYSDVSGGSAAAEITSEEDIIGSMMSVADSNHDGFVEFDEFEGVLQAKEEEKNEMMEEAFKVMDRDGDGKVGMDDLRSYMKWAGFCVSDEELKAMIRLGGGDESDGVCYQGLLKILAVC